MHEKQHMHDRRVLHRDIKLDNIMVVPPHSHSNPLPFPLVKVIDFNLATFFHPAFPLHETVGCIHYSSPWICAQASASAAFAQDPGHHRPEGLDPALFGVASDVWAFAVSLFGALQGYFPFRGLTVEALGAEVEKMTAGAVGHRLTYPTELSAAARHFIESALDPLAPTTAYALLWHPWILQLDQYAMAYPILAREVSPIAGRYLMASPWDAVLPTEATDDSWYPLSLLSAAARGRGDAQASSQADVAKREEDKAMDTMARALVKVAERAMGRPLAQQQPQPGAGASSGYNRPPRAPSTTAYYPSPASSFAPTPQIDPMQSTMSSISSRLRSALLASPAASTASPVASASDAMVLPSMEDLQRNGWLPACSGGQSSSQPRKPTSVDSGYGSASSEFNNTLESVISENI